MAGPEIYRPGVSFLMVLIRADDHVFLHLPRNLQFGLVGPLPDVINFAKLCCNWFRGCDSVWGSEFAIFHWTGLLPFIIIIIIVSLLRVDRMQPNNKCKWDIQYAWIIYRNIYIHRPTNIYTYTYTHIHTYTLYIYIYIHKRLRVCCSNKSNQKHMLKCS